MQTETKSACKLVSGCDSSVPEIDAALLYSICRSPCWTRLRQLTPILTGFEAAAEEFNVWVQLLLLEALQASGFFRTPDDSVTAERVQSKAPGANARFVAEALSILTRAGDTASLFSSVATKQP